LFCHEEHNVFEEPAASKFPLCQFTAIAHPDGVDPISTHPQTFRTRSGATLTSIHPLVKTVLVTLYEQGPLAMPFNELAAQTASRMRRSLDPAFYGELADVLAACYRREMVRVNLFAPSFCPFVTGRPIASPSARLQAQGDSRVTNREHRSIDLAPVDRLLLAHMDGIRDRDALVDIIVQSARQGQLRTESENASSLNDAELAAHCDRLFDQRASYLAKNGFLVG
jgi:hypothetical protein